MWLFLIIIDRVSAPIFQTEIVQRIIFRILSPYIIVWFTYFRTLFWTSLLPRFCTIFQKTVMMSIICWVNPFLHSSYVSLGSSVALLPDNDLKRVKQVSANRFRSSWRVVTPSAWSVSVSDELSLLVLDFDGLKSTCGFDDFFAFGFVPRAGRMFLVRFLIFWLVSGLFDW